MSKRGRKGVVQRATGAAGNRMNQYCCVLMIAVIAGAGLFYSGILSTPFSAVTTTITTTTTTRTSTLPVSEFEFEIRFEWKAGSGNDFLLSVFDVVTAPYIESVISKADSGSDIRFSYRFLYGQAIKIGLEFFGNSDGTYEQLPWPHGAQVPMSGRISCDYLPAGGAPISDGFYLDYSFRIV